MWKSVLFVSCFSLLLVTGCNNDDNNNDTETPMEDVENGGRDLMDDTRDAVDDTVDTVDPNAPGEPGQVNEGTVDNGNGTNVPNGSINQDGENGVTAPGAPSIKQEDIIEDDGDHKDKDKVDNH